MTDQTGPGTHILYQDVVLEPAMSHSLSMTVAYVSSVGVLAPNTLACAADPNQQYRIDIVKPTAAIDTLAPADILGTVFATQASDPTTLAPTPKTFNLTPFAGQTVRLRFAEVDNLGVFNAIVDDVKVTSTPLETTPPTCRVTAVRRPPGTASGHSEMDVTVTDTGSGLQAVTNLSIVNGVFSISPSTPFAAGTTTAVVTAIKSTEGSPTTFSFDAIDRAGNVRHCT